MSLLSNITRMTGFGKREWDATDRRLLDSKIYGYKDLIADLTAEATGSGSPQLIVFGPSGNIKKRRFGIGDSVYITYHINHDVAPGSICYPHVHWSSDGVDTDLVAWELNYTIAKGHQQEAFPVESTITLEQAGQGTAWYHMIVEDPTGFVIPEVDSLILMEIKRVAPSVGVNSDDIFGLFADIHFLSDRETTPRRAPDFYQGPVENG